MPPLTGVAARLERALYATGLPLVRSMAWNAATIGIIFVLVGEVLGMRWEELDLGTAWWTLPSARSKNKLAHRVPLGPQH